MIGKFLKDNRILERENNDWWPGSGLLGSYKTENNMDTLLRIEGAKQKGK